MRMIWLKRRRERLHSPQFPLALRQKMTGQRPRRTPSRDGHQLERRKSVCGGQGCGGSSRSESDDEQHSAQQGGFFGHESERVQGMGWMCHRQMYARRAAVRDEDVEGPFADGIEQDGVFQGGLCLWCTYSRRAASRTRSVRSRMACEAACYRMSALPMTAARDVKTCRKVSEHDTKTPHVVQEDGPCCCRTL